MEELKAQVYNVMNRTLLQNKKPQTTTSSTMDRETGQWFSAGGVTVQLDPVRVFWPHCLRRRCGSSECGCWSWGSAPLPSCEQRLHVHTPQLHHSSVLGLGMGCTELELGLPPYFTVTNFAQQAASLLLIVFLLLLPLSIWFSSGAEFPC